MKLILNSSVPLNNLEWKISRKFVENWLEEKFLNSNI